MTLIAQNLPLPLVRVTLLWGLAGAAGRRSALSVAFLVGGFANTFSIFLRVTVRTFEAARIVLGANWGTVIGVVAIASPILYLQRGAPMVRWHVSHRDITNPIGWRIGGAKNGG